MAKSTYCQICRKDFMNYFQHVEDEEHVALMMESWSQKKLEELCEKMKRVDLLQYEEQVSQKSEEG